MNLSQQKILITGGSGGIGLALASAFLQTGARVVICARNEQKLQAAAASTPGLLTLSCDLADMQAVQALPERASDMLGGLTMLVNNAGMQNNLSFADTAAPIAVAGAVAEIQTNLTSLIALCAWALPVLSRSESSAIVNVSSGLAFTPKADAVVYCATKAAVHNFSQGLRYQMEDANNGVSVIEVMPPLVATEMTAGRQDGAISADQVASEVLEGLKRDQQEIRVGKVKLLAALMRLSPSLAAKILRNS